jgi:FAD:protein FMN transferase
MHDHSTTSRGPAARRRSHARPPIDQGDRSGQRDGGGGLRHLSRPRHSRAFACTGRCFDVGCRGSFSGWISLEHLSLEQPRPADRLPDLFATTSTGCQRSKLSTARTRVREADSVLYRTTAWSTRVELMVTKPESMVLAASILNDELDRMDRIASRFRADSELSAIHVADRHGSPIGVSTDLCEVIAVALRAALLTDGAVDPTVGGAMYRLGYDRDFAQVSPGVTGRLPDVHPVPGWRTVELDVERSTVRFPSETVLDVGATGKALAADRAARAIAARLGCGALVSLGGDIAVAGASTVRFTVGVADVCGDPDHPVSVTLGPGGLATSGIAARQWSLGGQPVHHLVDPATGLPVEVHWRTVSVLAGSCVDANTASTASMVKGPAAVEWLEGLGLPARLVRPDGSVVTVGGWAPDGARTAVVDVEPVPS